MAEDSGCTGAEMITLRDEILHHIRAFHEFSLLGNDVRSRVHDLLPLSCDSLQSDVVDPLLEMAHAAMPSSAIAPALLALWRRLYTDLSLLKSLLTLASASAAQAISILDHAIIIAGAVGRLELIQTLISSIQADYRDDLLKSSGAVGRLPDFVMSAHAIERLRTCARQVPCYDAAPSLSAFTRSHYQMPFILRKFASHWPALNERPWCSPEYLLSVTGLARVVPIEVGSDYCSEEWTQRMMPWVDFLSSISKSQEEDDDASTPVLYLAQHSLFMQFPALENDFQIPDYVYSSPPLPKDYPDYTPPTNADQLVINGWLGPRGTISPAHTDPYFNIYTQVVGRKSVWLAPPGATPYMHAFSARDAAATADHISNPAENRLVPPSMSNTSCVDVFDSSAGPNETSDHADDNQQTDGSGGFWEHVVPVALSATLEPGDMLFFPPGWWHAMRSEDVSFSLSMWF